MSFASAQQRFAAQAARSRRDMNQVEIRPNVAGVLGAPLTVFMTATRREEDIAPNGFVVVHRAQLRVLKSLAWKPFEGAEFTVLATGEVFNCQNAAGADADYAAEIVCDVVRVSP